MRRDTLGGGISAGQECVHSGARLDRLPIGRFHYRLLWLISGGLFFDAFDVYLLAGVTGALVKEGFASMAQAAHVVSATYAGLVVGSFVAGLVGDRFGRKACYQINLAIVAVATLATALAGSVESMTVWRFIAGIGLGAEAVVSYATLSEFVPPARRGRWLGVTAFLANVAVFASALCGYFLLPMKEGWRWMFAIAAIGSGVVWVLRWRLTESPRWLESKGRTAQAESIMRRIEGDYEPGTVLPPFEPTSTARQSGAVPLSTLFQRDLRGCTAIGMLLAIVQYTAIYGLLVWLPAFFVKQGLALSTSLQYSLLMSAGGPFGAIVAAVLADRIGRRVGIVIFSLIATLLSVLYAVQSAPVGIVVVGFALFTVVYITATYAFAGYTPELFPTAVRSRGVALCNSVGRLVSVSLPYVIVQLFAAGGIRAVVAAVGSLLIVQTLVTWAWGPETNKASLEALDSAVSDRPGEGISVQPAQSERSR